MPDPKFDLIEAPIEILEIEAELLELDDDLSPALLFSTYLNIKKTFYTILELFIFNQNLLPKFPPKISS